MSVLSETSLFSNLDDDFLVRTGSELKSFHTERFEFKKRDFVYEVIQNFKTDKIKKVIGIAGIRGTGKTVGMFHIIDELNEYENTVFIEVLKKGTSMESLNRLMKRYPNCKYFFIDEISYISDFISNGHYLDGYVQSGISVVVSGTDSYAVLESRWSSLFHRMIIKRVSHITFSEHNRLTGISLDDYLKYGGLLDIKLFDNSNAKNLATSLITDNIVNSIMTNYDYFKSNCKFSPRVLSLTGNELSSYIRSIVFYIYYMVIISKVVRVNKNILARYGTAGGNETGSVRPVSHSEFLQLMGVNLDFEKEDYSRVLEILKDMECIYQLDNIENFNECRFYITTPCLSFMLFEDFKTIVNPERTKDTTFGSVFESVTVCEIIKHMGTGFYSQKSNNEIDCVLLHSDDVHKTLIEIKSNKIFDNCFNNSNSLKQYTDNCVKNKIICTKYEFERCYEKLKDDIFVIPFIDIIEYLSTVYD